MFIVTILRNDSSNLQSNLQDIRRVCSAIKLVLTVKSSENVSESESWGIHTDGCLWTESLWHELYLDLSPCS